MKKILNLWLVVFTILAILPIGVKAEEIDIEKPEANKEPVKVYIFRSDSCPHCINTMNFLKEMEEEYGDYYDVYDYETSDAENSALFEEVATFMGDTGSVGYVPYLVVGKYTYPDGFEPDNLVTDDQTMGEQLLERIMEVYQSDDRYDVMEALKNKPSYDTVVGIVAGVIIVGVVAMIVITRRHNALAEAE